MVKSVLVTGATGKQGGAVVNALLAAPDAADYKILAVTRDPNSASAQKLGAKSSNITLIKGDMNDCPALFASALEASPEGLYAVVAITALTTGDSGKLEDTTEYKQGVAMFDEAKKAGVKRFIYHSVDRGGDEKSWTTPTDIPHFITKHHIELYIRDHAGDVEWTFIRPVIFMDNLEPGMIGKMMLTYLISWMGRTKKTYWVATEDIGYFSALAVRTEELKNRAITTASDYVDFEDIDRAFKKVTGAPAPLTWTFFTWPLYFVAEMRNMFRWFNAEGYSADLDELRRLNPNLIGFEEWLQTRSKFPKKSDQ